MLHEIKEGYVKVETHHYITTIEFFHPKGNCLPAKLIDELAKEIHFAGHHDETKVIVLKSAGEKIFCSGASIDELKQLNTVAEGTKFFAAFAHLINTMRKCPKFIIGRVQGKCIGGGVGLVAAMDYAIGTQSADIKLSELSLGIGPFVIGPVVERKIGISSFSSLAINSGNWRTAEWARKKGLYAEIHEDKDNLDEAVDHLANKLAHSHLDAMTEMKKIFWRGTDHWDDLLKERAAITGSLIVSDFVKNNLHKTTV